MFQRTKLCTHLLLAFGVLPVFAQDAQNQVQRIEITGSAIKRVSSETALPVTTISRVEIERTGATTAQDLIGLIPSNFGGTVISTNVGSTGNPSTANLRDLGVKYTLVLLNGRRVANYAFGNSPVDLNSIPVSAIEKVEVLRDGASSLYGADAIAGVINFILRKDYRGAEVSAYATSVDAKGGGNTQSFNVSAGFGDLGSDGFNVFVSANHEESERLQAKDRKFANSAVRPELGIDNTSSRNGIPNLTFSDTRGNAYTSVNPMRYLGCNAPEFALTIRSATECGTDYVKFIDLIPETKHDNVVARGVMQLGNEHQVYVEAAYTKDYLAAAYSPAPYTNPFNGYPEGGRFYPTSITLPKGMTLPAGYVMPDGTVLATETVLAADLAVTPTGPIRGRWRTVAGGGRNDITDTTNYRVLLGAQGLLAGWDYDTALAYSRNEGVISFGAGQYDYSKLTPLLESGEINIFGQQDAQSLAALDQARLTGKQRSAVSESTEVDFHASKELSRWTHGPLALALGGSLRREKLDQISYPVLASGNVVGGDGPVPSVVGSRDVMGFFGELSVPLYKDLELQAAARYDNLKNSFGTSFNNISPKLALRYQPTKDLLMRASVGQGFRAPTLYENLRPFTSGGATAGSYNDPIRCPNGVPVDSPNPVGDLQDECSIQLTTATVGDKNLKPEKSTQFSLGMAFQLTSRFSGSVDYWDVSISDAIQQKSEIQVLNDPTRYVNNFYRYDPASFPGGWVDDGNQTGAIRGSTNPDFPLAYIFLPYENTASIYAAGIDLNLQYKQAVEGVGKLGANLDATLFTRHGYKYPGTTAVSDLGSYQGFGPSPRWRHGLTFTWAAGPWNASLTHNYTSGYRDFTDTAAIGDGYPAKRMVSAYQTVDMTLGWAPMKGLDLGFGVKNLLDQDPPSTRKSSGFQVGYDEANTNPLGRMFYLKARYKFL